MYEIWMGSLMLLARGGLKTVNDLCTHTHLNYLNKLCVFCHSFFVCGVSHHSFASAPAPVLRGNTAHTAT